MDRENLSHFAIRLLENINCDDSDINKYPVEIYYSNGYFLNDVDETKQFLTCDSMHLISKDNLNSIIYFI